MNYLRASWQGFYRVCCLVGGLNPSPSYIWLSAYISPVALVDGYGLQGSHHQQGACLDPLACMLGNACRSILDPVMGYHSWVGLQLLIVYLV